MLEHFHGFLFMLFDLENVQKNYGSFRALDGVSFKVESGSVGLLGPNGAGKSTLIKTLLGLLSIDGGSASILGFRLPAQAAEIRKTTGYMPENDSFLPYMTAVDYVTFGGRLAGMPKADAFRRAHEVLYYVGLGEARYRELSGFSTGMKQRVKLAQALVHGPKLLFLDEPTNGLDPQGRDEILSLIEDVKLRGLAVVLSTHLLSDVERVCESVVMLNNGKLLHHGTVAALKTSGDRILEIEPKNEIEKLIKILRAHNYNVSQHALRAKIILNENTTTQEILKVVVDNKIQIRHFVPGELTLEAAFLNLLDEAV